MKKVILLFAMALTFATANAQSIGINNPAPNASAALDVTSTTQGVLVPRMTAAQRGLIATPATGLLVYQTDATAGFYFYNGTAWTSLSGGGSALPTQAGNAGKYLKTDGTAAAWDTPGMPVMTKAQRDALVSPANGTTIYQSDVYAGIYTKQFDGWRCMSGDGPIFFHDVGTLTANNGPLLVLDATHHTVVIMGTWTAIFPEAFQLPDARLCPGRKYRIIVNNLTTTEVTEAQANGSVRTYGYAAQAKLPVTTPFSEVWPFFPVRITKTPFVTAFPIPGGSRALFGDGRVTEVTSTGSTWYCTQMDLLDPNEMED